MVASSPLLKTNIRYMRVRYNVNNCVVTTALTRLDFYLVIKENRCERVRYYETSLYYVDLSTE